MFERVRLNYCGISWIGALKSCDTAVVRVRKLGRQKGRQTSAELWQP